MSNIHFSPKAQQVPDYVLNHPSNSLEKNNIRFKIKGQYLTDFTDKGIEKFIEKNYNDKSGFLGGIGLGWGGKDLDLNEVKAFIQQAVANSDKIQGVTFDLADPELGLFDDDDTSVKDIKSSFNLTLDKTPGKSASEVSFVDVTSASYDLKTASKAEKAAHGKFQKANKAHSSVVNQYEKAKKSRDKIADRIGGGAIKRLAEIDGRLERIGTQKSELSKEIKEAEFRLRKSDLDPKLKTQIGREIRGMKAELDDLSKEDKKLHKELNKNHGFWSFAGGGSDLKELRQANKKLKQAEARMKQSEAAMSGVKSDWQDAVKRREGVESGKSLAELDAIAKPPVKPEPAAPKPPAVVDDSTTPPVANPTKPPATPGEVVPPTGEVIKPNPDGVAATPPVTPVAPTAPVSDNTAKIPDLALEQQLQQLLQLDKAAQMDALKSIPTTKQSEFLQINHDYINAGDASNPLGLSESEHKTLHGLQGGSIELMKNAFTSWGKDAFDQYMAQLDEEQKKALTAQLGGDEFAKSLVSQKPTPAVTPPAADPVKPEPKVTAPVTPVPVQPQAPKAGTEHIQPGHQTTAPLVEKPATNAPIQPVAPKPVEAPPVNIPKQAVVTPPQPPVAPTPPAKEAPNLRPPEALPNPATKAAVPPPAPVKPAAVAPVETQPKAEPKASLTQTQLLALPADQHYARYNELSSKDQVDLFSKLPTTNKADLLFEVLKLDNIDVNGRANMMNSMSTEEKQSIMTMLDNTLKQPGFEDPKLRAPVMQFKSELGKLTSPPGPVATPPQTDAKTDMSAEAFTALPPDQQVSKFADMPLANKQTLFKGLALQLKTELLLSLTIRTPDPTTRQALMGQMSASDKAAAMQVLTESLPGVQTMPALKDGITALLQEFGAQTAKPTQPGGPPDLANIQPVTGKVQSDTGPPKMNMSVQIDKIKELAANKTMMGYGSVANPGQILELADQIWNSGTSENRLEMAKAMIESDLSKELSGILAQATVSSSEVANLMTQPGFPVEEYMNAIDDSKSTIMLMSLTEAYSKGNKGASSVIEKTVTAYQSGYDREGPIQKMKNDALARGNWDKLPQATRAHVDKMFDTWWN